MLKRFLLVACTIAASTAAAQQAPPAAEAPQAPTAAAAAQTAPAAPARDPAASGTKEMSGMSILGNQETPTSLVIVPWKSSEIGNGIGVSRALDTRIRAVDKDVFTRELKYYAIRSGIEN